MSAGQAARIVAATMFLAAVPAATQQQGSSNQPPPQDSSSAALEALDTGPLVVPGAAPDLTILYTGNVAGLVSPCG